MGANQIGGIATLLDIDFNNAAGFVGERVASHTGMPNFLVYYLSPAMLFCTGSIIESHVIVTSANCLIGQHYQFDVFAGTHDFIEQIGVERLVEHVAIYRTKALNRTRMCSSLALLILGEQFFFQKSTPNSQFSTGRVRYGITMPIDNIGKTENGGIMCVTYGWGSRRNGFLVPLLIHLQQVQFEVLPAQYCEKMWNCNNQYLCIRQYHCKNDIYGSVCPDDLGSPLVCSGFLHGMMVSRMIDRPCGVGFIDLTKFHKFLTCGVDDSRTIVGDTGAANLDLQKTRAPEITTTVSTIEDELRRLAQ